MAREGPVAVLRRYIVCIRTYYGYLFRSVFERKYSVVFQKHKTFACKSVICLYMLFTADNAFRHTLFVFVEKSEMKFCSEYSSYRVVYVFLFDFSFFYLTDGGFVELEAVHAHIVSGFYRKSYGFIKAFGGFLLCPHLPDIHPVGDDKARKAEFVF